MKLKYLAAFGVLFCLLAGCTKGNDKGGLYLSIVVTTMNSKNESCMNVFDYYLKTKKVKPLIDLEHASQYPLAVYDKSDNKIYYSIRADGGGQLFSLDLNNNETRQITDQLFAVNYILPGKDKVYLLVVLKGQRSIKPAVYDKIKDEFQVLNQDDTLNFDLLTYDVYHDCLYASAATQEEWDKALDESNEANNGAGTKYMPPDYCVYRFDKDFSSQTQVLKTQRKLIRRMAADPDGSFYFTEADSIPEWEPVYVTQRLNADHSISPFVDIDNLSNIAFVNEYLYFISNDEFLFLGTDSANTRGIYQYNIKTKKLELIFNSERGMINSFSLLRKYPD